MSAFVVDSKVINQIVFALDLAIQQEGQYPATFPDLRYINSKSLRELAEEPSELGRTMYSMNINAVEQRYPDGDLPGTYTDGEALDAYKYRREETSPIQVYKSLSCYLYQCSEGDVFELPLYNALKEFKSALAEHMVEKMPEYDKAAW